MSEIKLFDGSFFDDRSVQFIRTTDYDFKEARATSRHLYCVVSTDFYNDAPMSLGHEDSCDVGFSFVFVLIWNPSAANNDFEFVKILFLSFEFTPMLLDGSADSSYVLFI